MRPQKLSREQLLQYCMPVFKQHGYQGTSMAMLASACDLTKGAFYYEYQDKESLVADMLRYVHQLVDHKLFSLVYEAGTVQIRYQRLHEQAVKFFSQGGMGCLMAVIGGEARYLSPSLLALTQQFFSRWQQAMQVLFDVRYIPKHRRLPLLSKVWRIMKGRFYWVEFMMTPVIYKVYMNASMLN